MPQTALLLSAGHGDGAAVEPGLELGGLLQTGVPKRGFLLSGAFSLSDGLLQFQTRGQGTQQGRVKFPGLPDRL